MTLRVILLDSSRAYKIPFFLGCAESRLEAIYICGLQANTACKLHLRMMPFNTCADVASRSHTILILLHDEVPAVLCQNLATLHPSEALRNMDLRTWSELTSAFTLVTEMFTKEGKLLQCSQNCIAISTAVGVITNNAPYPAENYD